ncbi:response regulator [Scandinavium sp. M-37]|uniref:PFGI-1 class ICE element type IV pilus protein PilL2 n=1 Tax=Scandinavium sp. M-37 TaxID=3373077 RepID=UPI0037455C05
MPVLRIYLPVAVLMLSACTARQPASLVTPVTAMITRPGSPSPAEVVHTARYTLVNITPDEVLRQPLRQITRHTLPATKRHSASTRGDALRAWLAGTGYGLCLPVSREARGLFSSPLPEVWRSTGPMRVESALQAIAGSAWKMSTDELTRTVCFQPVMPGMAEEVVQ